MRSKPASRRHHSAELKAKVLTALRKGSGDVRAMIVGIASGGQGTPGWPPHLVAGRHITRSHYEAVADEAAGFRLGDVICVRRNDYAVVGVTRRMVSSSGDPMVFIPLRDAQEAQFLKDNDAIRRSRRRTAENPAFNRPGVPGLLHAVIASQDANPHVNAVLVRIKPGHHPEDVAQSIRRWKRLTVYTRAQMEEILLGKLIATSALQIAMFLAILAWTSPTTSPCCRCSRGCRTRRRAHAPSSCSARSTSRIAPARRRRSGPAASSSAWPSRARWPTGTPVILADEPTAPLDSERALAVIRILNDMARQFETAVIVVTHDEKIIPTFKRIYHIRDGVTHEEAGEGRSLGRAPAPQLALA